VRDRLNLEKGKPFDRVGAIGSHVISLAAVVGLAVFGFASWLTVGVFVFLAARCIYGLSEYRVKMRAMPAKSMAQKANARMLAQRSGPNDNVPRISVRANNVLE
jgi:hypothetical protein